jgi:hypothetical protein
VKKSKKKEAGEEGATAEVEDEAADNGGLTGLTLESEEIGK